MQRPQGSINGRLPCSGSHLQSLVGKRVRQDFPLSTVVRIISREYPINSIEWFGCGTVRNQWQTSTFGGQSWPQLTVVFLQLGWMGIAGLPETASKVSIHRAGARVVCPPIYASPRRRSTRVGKLLWPDSNDWPVLLVECRKLDAFAAAYHCDI